MLTIRIIAVGKIKQAAKYLETGIALYQKRLAPHFKVEWVEVAEEAPTATRTVDQIKDREAEAILRQCGDTATVILLGERGRLMHSAEFSDWFFSQSPLDGGRGSSREDRIIFIIGGAFGTSEKLTARATQTISLSPLTFPHQMVRLILMEQLYRAVSIAHGDPYHKL